MDVTHKILEISPGVKFSGWTFGDQVPGPTIRARVGDRIRFTMTNRSDEPVPGVRVTAAPMMHSMDFHAAMVSPQDKYRSIAPGQTIEFEFTVNYPGIFMYHCGTPMVLEHIASGMYGAVVVEPRAGFPTKVDREYVVIQSEFYARPDPDKRKVDGAPLYVLDGDRLTLPPAPSVRLRLSPKVRRPDPPLALMVRGASSAETEFETYEDVDTEAAVVGEDGTAWLRVSRPGSYELHWFVRHTGTGVEHTVEQSHPQTVEVTDAPAIPGVETSIGPDEVERAIHAAGG